MIVGGHEMSRFHLVFATLIVTMVSIGIFRSQTVIFAQNSKVQTENNVTFLWSFGAIRNTGTGPRFESITRDTAMKSGDKIKFFLRVENNCFVYLIYQSSQGDLSVLFPYRFKMEDKGYQTSENYYIPKGEQWFELDEYSGTEKFYLIANANRLAELENLLNEYESADKSNKRTISKEIISKIRKLRKTNRNLKTHVEKPVTIIGKMRGTEKTKAAGIEDIADYAIEISAKNFFSRTFTIDHK
jgi:hypothetical protein